MKNILNQLKFVPIVFIFVFLFASESSAQSVTFNGDPVINIQETNGNITASLSGQFIYGPVTPPSQNTEVRVTCSANVISGPGDYPTSGSDFIEITMTFGNGQITSGNNFSTTITNQGMSNNFLVPGETIYCLFEIFYSSNNTPLDPRVVTALVPGTPGGPGPGGGPITNPPVADPGTIDPLNDSTGSYEWPANVIPNTLSVEDINSFVVGLLNALLKIGIPILILFFVYSGLKFVMARGNEKELEEAKKNLLWVIIGGAILLGSWTIVKVLKGTIDQIEITSIYQIINYFV
jgi:hypothetical protein